jgi:hypothetical protein
MAIMDIATRIVHLDSPVYGKVIFHLPMISHIKGSLHHVVQLKLEDIHVFPYDLPGMPPERDIEFNIELQPGMGPIAKARHKMSPIVLVELKIQL